MAFSSLKPVLILLHRWIGLIFAPIFLVVILSGGVLALRPIVNAGPAPAPVADPAALVSLVTKLEVLGPLSQIAVTPDGRGLDVNAAAAVSGRYDLASGARIGAAPIWPDLFDVATRLHKNLLVGLGLAVEAAAWLMLAIMIVGPLLSWLRFRNNFRGWHIAAGWLLLPIAILAPLTGALMTIGLGGGGPRGPRPSQPTSISEALTAAQGQLDLKNMASARRFRGTQVQIVLTGGEGAEGGRFAVAGGAVTPMGESTPLVRQIHVGTWAGAWSGAFSLVVALILGLLTVTGFMSWYARKRRDSKTGDLSGADLLVAYASQTGTAARFADLTARAFETAGTKTAVAPLGALAPGDFSKFSQVLIVAATTGEGDLPDSARKFAKNLAGAAISGARFAVFALGDKRYNSFCGGAQTLRAGLIAAGAQENMVMFKADGDPSAMWLTWLADLETKLGLKNKAAAPAAAPMVALRLIEKSRLDNPAVDSVQPCWAMAFQSDRDLDFRPGDLLRLSPGPGQALRAYSIGSSSRVDPRRIELTVRRHEFVDAQGAPHPGAMSGRLAEATPGEIFEAQLDSHPGFHPPKNPETPVVMIAAGSGLAPFPGFIAERAGVDGAGPCWLFFGNRRREGDFLWRDRLEAALRDGALTRLDAAFSRDAEDGAYVQARIVERAAELAPWLLEQGAMVYICGSRAMADAARAALAEVLVCGGKSAAEAAQWIEDGLAEGRIRIDAFD